MMRDEVNFHAVIDATREKERRDLQPPEDILSVERARIYVKDPSKAPPGVQLNKGPRGGMWFDSNSVPKRTGYKPAKLPATKKPPKGKAPKKPEKEDRPKREFGQPLRDAEDLPPNVRRESEEVQAAYMKTFNSVLAAGGAEADALAIAKEVLPKRGAAAAKPEKRQVGQPFNSFDDPSIPLKVRQESEAIKREWVLAFNVELKKGGSEADAIAAANEKLPDRKKPKPVKPPRSTLPKTEESKKWFDISKAWNEANQLRDDDGQFAGTTGGGGGGGADLGKALSDNTVDAWITGSMAPIRDAGLAIEAGKKPKGYGGKEAREMMGAIDGSPVIKGSLYRGLSVSDKDLAAMSSGSVKLGLSSFSSDKKLAGEWSSLGGKQNRVVLELSGARAVNISGHKKVKDYEMGWQKESVSYGSFNVTGVRKSGDITYISLSGGK